MKINFRYWLYLLLPPVLACVVAVAAGQLGYLVFHVLAELFSIIIGFTVLVVALAAHAFSRNHYILFAALVMATASGIDLAHTLVYAGMGLLPVQGSNTATQLWLLARALQAVGLALAPIYLLRSFKVWQVCTVLAAVIAAAVFSMLQGWFPLTYVTGSGLTPFKIYAEYVIISILVMALIHLYLRRKLLAPSVWKSLTAMTLLTMASEFAFTRYVSAYGQANMVGHLLKILAFWALYLALIDNSLRRPFDTMAKALTSYDALPYPIVTVGFDRQILQANKAAAQWVGASQLQLVGKDVHALFHDVHVPADQCPVCIGLQQGEAKQEFQFTRKHGAHRHECTLVRVKTDNQKMASLQIYREVSASAL